MVGQKSSFGGGGTPERAGGGKGGKVGRRRWEVGGFRPTLKTWQARVKV